jgi:UDP-N-acetylglucosamine:LPS N-acetylglucosamine transferase
MKNSILNLTLFAISAALLCSGEAQNAPSQLFKAVSELKEQQTQIADNQTKIDGKIADLAEAVRAARLFMSRAGGKHTPPKP